MNQPTQTLDLRTLVDLEAWQNPRFRAEVQRDPKAAVTKLAARHGITLPEGIEFRAVSDTEKVYHLVISENPVGASPEEFGSEVRAYVESFARAGATGIRGKGDLDRAKASSTGLFGLCNTAICSAVNPQLCVRIGSNA